MGVMMITIHARQKIFGRLQGIVSEQDVYQMERASEEFTDGKHYVKVRQLSTAHYTDDSVGDTIACIIQDGNVKTAMLCWSSKTWHDGETWRLT